MIIEKQQKQNISSQGHGNVKYNISVLFDLFMPYQTVLTKGWFEGGLKKLSNPHAIHETPRGWFGVGLCWDLGMFQAIIEISIEQNVSKNNKNKLFPPVLSWFDLAVTLKWPFHDLGRPPLWYQTWTDVTYVFGLGFDRVIWSASPTIYSQPFWADLPLLWPWDDLTKTLG